MNIVLYHPNIQSALFEKNGEREKDGVMPCLCDTIDDEITDTKRGKSLAYRTILDVQLNKGVGDMMLEQQG